MNRLPASAFLLVVPFVIKAQVPQDLTSVQWKVTSMRSYFSAVWQDFFLNEQTRLYISPKLVPYTGSTTSACGRVDPDNAAYCSKDNTIYYDSRFLATMMKAAASSLRTDGDYAPVVILAHEWGHAAAFWHARGDKKFSWQTFSGEQLADCLAGAVTRLAGRAGKLAGGDLEEAEFAIREGQDPSGGPAPPGFPKLQSHGAPADRLRAFRKGYQGTTSGCLADLKLGGY